MHVLTLGHSTPTERRHPASGAREGPCHSAETASFHPVLPPAPRPSRVHVSGRHGRLRPSRQHIDQQTCTFKSHHLKPSPGQKQLRKSKAAAEETPAAPGPPHSSKRCQLVLPSRTPAACKLHAKPSPCALPVLGVRGANSVGMARPEGHPASVTRQSPCREDFLTPERAECVRRCALPAAETDCHRDSRPGKPRHTRFALNAILFCRMC